MKTNKLLFDIRYGDVFEKKLALNLMISNRVMWVNNFKDVYIMDNDFKFIREATPEELLDKMKEIDLLIFNRYYEKIKQWTKHLENDEKLIKMTLRWYLGPFASFKLNKIEAGLYEVILPEPFDFEQYWNFNIDYEEFEQIKKYIKNLTKENFTNWNENLKIKIGKREMNVKLIPPAYFYYEFSSNFDLSIKEVSLK